ncbi:hypothetical protein [Sigmofec virus UA08Rod_3874]|uniref:Uncharacterized protein n=1 Tax=Sigmofec virus UA08Rod_3874 TaxID=2929391 RepID=A0A976N1V9_9VIRU|nr:hypothetical protein [Sigmofec virus UA08Rod_3874]
MAFRKTVRCSNRPIGCFGGFYEKKSVPVNDGSGVEKIVVCNVTTEEISEECLPLVSAKAVLQSGNYIQGNVSFAPSDPTDIGNVAEVVESYAEAVDANNREARYHKMMNPEVKSEEKSE